MSDTIRIQDLNLDGKPEKREMKTELSVFTYPYRWRSIGGILSNIRTFFYNIRCMFQRARKGVCDKDTWNFDYTLIDYLIASLTQFRNHTCCYPDRDFASFEDWIAYLDDIIDKLDFVRQSADEDLNKWYNAWQTQCCSKPRDEWADEDELVFRKYIEETERLTQEQAKVRKSAFIALSKHLPDIWW